MQIGLLALGDCIEDPGTGLRPTPGERHGAIVEEAVLAESLGFDSVWLGEQHSGGSVLASPQVLLAAIAARTSRVRLGTCVPRFAHLDPVRVAEDYATLDAISEGRIEVAAAFGGEPDEDRERHREHLALLLQLWREIEVTWNGRFRAPLGAVTVAPRPVQKPHPPVWVGVASLRAADLAAELGLPLMLPGPLAPALDPVPLVARYRERLAAAGHGPAAARVGCCHPVHGSPAEVVDRIGAAHEALGLDLHLAIFDQGGLPPAAVARTMDLYASAIAPHLRKLGAGPGV